MFPNNQDESSKHLLARLYKKFDAQKSSKLVHLKYFYIKKIKSW